MSRSQHAAVAAPLQATVLAPMSATAAELLHRLQQEAAEAVTPAPGSVMLPPPVKACGTHSTDTSYYVYFDGYSTRKDFYLRHQRESQAKWAGSEERTDSDGRRWERRIAAVVDDFGELVEVVA